MKCECAICTRARSISMICSKLDKKDADFLWGIWVDLEMAETTIEVFKARDREPA